MKHVNRLQRLTNVFVSNFQRKREGTCILPYFFGDLALESLIVLTLVAGWLLHGMIVSQPIHHALTFAWRKYFARNRNVPISSQLGTSTRNNPLMDPALNSINSNQLKLTAGLHPGRGQANSRGSRRVTALPVKDVSFYNWRGELTIRVAGAYHYRKHQ